MVHFLAKKIKTIIFLLITMLLVGTAHAEEDFFKILLKADQARGNYDGISWKVNILARNKQRNYYVRAKGFDLLGETLSPAKHKGDKLLMVSGNMWFYKPGLSRPIPISRRQRLYGEASYGDIAATNYAYDYSIESVHNADLNGKTCWVFDLKSKSKKNNYDLIRYWIDQKQKTGIKADYFSVSGKKIKSAILEYQHTIDVGEKKWPFLSKISILDSIKTESATIISLSEPKLKKIPHHYFNVNFLRK
ncbi:MAG: outer membrane lipoprotein-sorting protein [Pseudomonadota bacterium]